MGYWLLAILVEPVGDVAASIEHDWICEWALPVFLNQFCQIKDHVEFRNPTVICGVVLLDFRGEIESSQLILGWHVFGKVFLWDNV